MAALESLPFLASLLVSVVCEIGGEELYHSLKPRPLRQLLKNHDVERALHESYIITLNQLEKDFTPKALTKSGVERAFKTLRMQSFRSLVVEDASEDAWDQAIAHILTSPGEMQAITGAINDQIPSASTRLHQYIAEFFPGEFVFVFTQIGIKHNEAVRAAVQHALLSDIYSSASESREQIAAVDGRLERIDEVAYEIESRWSGTERALDGIEERIKAVAKVVAELRLLQMSSSGGGTVIGSSLPKAHLVISAEDGTPLGRSTISTSPVVVGRHDSCDVRLLHGSVSRKQAVVELHDGYVAVANLGLRNPIRVGGLETQLGQMVVFGEEILVGPYLLTFLSLETPATELPTATTIAYEA